jgi:hypothetical protein
VQRPLSSGPKGITGLLHGHALQEVVTRNLKLEVGGSQTWWPTGHVARLANQHLACYRLNEVGNSSLDPINTPYRWNSRHHTLLVVLHL